MWILAQGLPLSDAAEIAKQLDQVQMLGFLLILAFVVITMLIGVQFKNQNDTNKAIRENNEAIRDVSKAIEANTDKNTEIVKIVLENDKEGDRFLHERLMLLEQDFRIVAKTSNEFMAIIKSIYGEDDTIAKRMKAAIQNGTTESRLDETKSIPDEMLDKLDT